MRIFISGHTSGIGKYLYDNLDGEVIGASRSNGKPITEISKWFDESCDLFINNAYDDSNSTAQSESLKYVYSKWKNDSSKMIISIGSMAPDFEDYDKPSWYNKSAERYTGGKKILDKTNYKYYMKYDEVRCTIIRPGYVDTPRISSLPINKSDMLSVDDILKVVNFIINFDGRIREITIENK